MIELSMKCLTVGSITTWHVLSARVVGKELRSMKVCKCGQHFVKIPIRAIGIFVLRCSSVLRRTILSCREEAPLRSSWGEDWAEKLETLAIWRQDDFGITLSQQDFVVNTVLPF